MSLVQPAELLRAVWDADPVTVSISGSSARNSSDLVGGVYYIISTTNCHFKQGDSSITATTSSNYLPAGSCLIIRVTGSTNARVAFIQNSASGTAFIMCPKGSP